MTEPGKDTRNIHERIEAAKANFPAIFKQATGQVGTRHYQYADITSVVDGVEPALTAEGVGIFPTVEMGDVVTELRIIDAPVADENARVVCSIPLPADLTPQQVGSAITYFRRYELVLLLNLLTEDDDGASASQPAATVPANTPAERAPAPEAQVAEGPVVPEGWESYEQAAAAHQTLATRIADLPEDFRSPCIEFRRNNGWPLSVPLFEELEAVVRVAEGLNVGS